MPTIISRPTWPRRTRRTRSSCRAHVQVVAGLRFDHFDLQYHNNRNGDTLDRPDNLVSPRAGVVFKPIAPRLGLRQLQRVVSAQLGRSVLVADDDHAAGEAGEVHATTKSARSGTRAQACRSRRRVYRLDRTNTRSTDPNDPTRIVQTGSQRTNGFELGVNGRLTRAGTSPAATPIRMRSSRSATTAARRGRAGGAGAASHVLAVEQLPDPPAAGGRPGHRSIGPTCSRRSTTR